MKRFRGVIFSRAKNYIRKKKKKCIMLIKAVLYSKFFVEIFFIYTPTTSLFKIQEKKKQNIPSGVKVT